jgi:hypothetical protein
MSPNDIEFSGERKRGRGDEVVLALAPCVESRHARLRFFETYGTCLPLQKRHYCRTPG